MHESDESDAAPGLGDPEDELYQLTRAFRRHLQWQARAGVYMVSAADTAKPADWPYAGTAGDPMPVQREERDEHESWPGAGANAGAPAAGSSGQPMVPPAGEL
jgi:hypothetical protein